MKTIKYISLCCMLILGILFLTSCGGSVTILTGGLVIQLQLPEEVTLLATGYNLDLTEVDLTVSKDSQTINKKIDLNTPSPSVSFEELEEGVWDIDVVAKNSQGYDVLSGSATGNVTGSDTTNATVELAMIFGELSADVTLPPDGTVAKGTITLIDPAEESIQMSSDLTIGQTSGTATISNIPPTTWQLQVKLWDASDLIVATGEEMIDIVPGELTTVQVTPAIAEHGDLEIHLSVHTPPAPPTGVTGVLSENQVQLSWTPNTEANMAGYLVYRSWTATGAKTLVTNEVVVETSYTDAIDDPTQTYYYWIVAVDTDRYSSNLSSVWTTTPGELLGANYQIIFTDYNGNRSCYSTDLTGQNVQWSHVEYGDLISADYQRLARIWNEDHSWTATFMTMNVDGSNRQQFTQLAVPPQYKAWSADESRFVLSHGGGYIYTVDADGSNGREVIQLGAELRWLDISADGQWVYYLSTNYSSYTLGKVDINGQNQMTLVEDRVISAPALSPDGNTLVYWKASDYYSPYTLSRISVTGTDSHDFLTLDEIGSRPAWSPDGEYIAFGGVINGTSRLYVIDLFASGGHSLDVKASRMFWSPDGEYLIFTQLTTEEDGFVVTSMDLAKWHLATDEYQQITFTDDVQENLVAVLPE